MAIWSEVTNAGNSISGARGIAISGNGDCQLVGTGYPSYRLYLSTDRGDTWTEQRPAGNVDRAWDNCIAIDDDGSVMIAGVYSALSGEGRLYLSTNSGSTWSEVRPAGNVDRRWRCAAMNSDGSIIIVGSSSYSSGLGRLYLSTNSGSTWSEVRPAGDVDISWDDCASDYDGSVLVVGGCNNTTGGVYVSTNSGTNWTRRYSDNAHIWRVDCSDDGSVILGCQTTIQVVRSTNGGVNWTDVTPADETYKAYYATCLSGGGTVSFISSWGTYGHTWLDIGDGWVAQEPDGDEFISAVAGDISRRGGVILLSSSTKLYRGLNYFSAPNAPTLTTPTGGEDWREGSVQTLTYTAASPEQDESAPCEYEFELSLTGDFDDTITIDSAVTGGAGSYTVPLDLVEADVETAKVRVRAKIVGLALYSTYDTSDALTVVQYTLPVASLVTPLDEALLPGLLPTFVFGTAHSEGELLHVEFQVSTFADFRDYHIDTDSAADFALWQDSADPFATWATVEEAGITAGDRVRYATQDAFRYDVYYGRVRLKDPYVIGAWTTFSFTISVDSSLALQVTIDGTTYNVTKCVIVENTGGEASPIDLEINLAQHLANPITKGAEIAVASGLGNHNRSWNGTVESWHFAGTAVAVHALQDDAYLSRKVVTGDEASADLGANLQDFVDDYGTPLTGTAIDTSTGVSMALTGGYKLLREHFQDAMRVLPSYLLWVDSGGDIHFVDQDGLDYPTIELYEEDPA